MLEGFHLFAKRGQLYLHIGQKISYNDQMTFGRQSEIRGHLL